VRPNRSGLKAGPLASYQKRARSLRNEAGGGSEASEAGRVSGEAEAEVLHEVASAAAAAEAVEAIRASIATPGYLFL
jgi:hypothetical protein